MTPWSRVLLPQHNTQCLQMFTANSKQTQTCLERFATVSHFERATSAMLTGHWLSVRFVLPPLPLWCHLQQTLQDVHTPRCTHKGDLTQCKLHNALSVLEPTERHPWGLKRHYSRSYFYTPNPFRLKREEKLGMYLNDLKKNNKKIYIYILISQTYCQTCCFQTY